MFTGDTKSNPLRSNAGTPPGGPALNRYHPRFDNLEHSWPGAQMTFPTRVDGWQW